MSSKTLEEKGEAILETIRNVREKHKEMDEKLQQLVRIATYYSHGIDPQEIEHPVTKQWDQTVEEMVAVFNMKDGSIHRIPVKELE